MEQVRRSLQESEEMATTLKKRRKTKDLKIQRERTKADINKAEQELQTDEYISVQRVQLDKAEEKELSEFAKRIEKEQIAQLKKVLSDQRALFARMISKERAIANEVLQKTREEKEEIIKKERNTIDFLNNESRAQVDALENDHSNLKGLIDNLIALIKPQQVHRDMNVEVPHDMISMQRSYFNIAVDNYCRPGLVMKFKVFKLEELYPDLQKYDLRAHLREFGIQGTSIEFADFERALTYHGYILDAEVYYLNPAPGSKPPTGLVKIVGKDDVNKMVRAHAEEGTKICLLYLVSTHDDQSPGPEDKFPDDEMEAWIPGESDEQANA